MSFPCLRACVVTALALAGCSPALNWREIRPEASELLALFPCKPDRFARTLMLAGGPVQIRLVSCAAEGVTYALTYAELNDVARVADALAQLRDAAAANIGGQAVAPASFSVSGMTPHPLAQLWNLHGHAADGAPVREQVGFFVKARRVYQATIVGEKIDAEAADTFFSGLKLGS
jgi:hypothetical protein